MVESFTRKNPFCVVIAMSLPLPVLETAPCPNWFLIEDVPMPVPTCVEPDEPAPPSVWLNVSAKLTLPLLKPVVCTLAMLFAVTFRLS